MKFKQLVVAGLILSIASFAKAAPSSEFVVKDIRVEG
ncbi:MAG: outer membrane protein insertion porin family, partial [Paraglaciecola sp.]